MPEKEMIKQSCRNCAHAEVCYVALTLHDQVLQWNGMFKSAAQQESAGKALLTAFGQYCKNHDEMEKST